MFDRFGIDMRGKIGHAAVTDQQLYRWFGFETAHSLDCSDYEGATHIADLNEPLPDDLRGKYDVVLDSGTVEHVFRIDQAMRNTVDLLKVGGRAIFLSPSSNLMEHGFYCLSPLFFWECFLANGFTIDMFYIVKCGMDPTAMWEAYRYEPKLWANAKPGELHAAAYYSYVVATKTADKPVPVIQQKLYRDIWETGLTPLSSTAARDRARKHLPAPLYDSLVTVYWRAKMLRERIKRRTEGLWRQHRVGFY